MLLAVFILTIVYSFCGASNALKCYECVYYKSNTDIDLLKDATGQANVQCRYPILGSVPSKTCPLGTKCGAITGSVTVNNPIGDGSYSTEVVVRDCMPAVSNGCDKLDGDAQKLFNGFLTFLAGTKINDASVCSCDWDMCDATCGRDSVRVGSFCVKMWLAVAGGIGGSVIFLFLVTCCCCCCCRCCRRKNVSRGVIIQNVPQSTAVTSTSTIQFSMFPPNQAATAQPTPLPYDKAWDTTDDTEMLIA